MILRALSALWTSVAPYMADHLWQSTLFVVLAAILALALRKNQARIRYWVWLTASVKFLIPFSLLIALGSHLAKPRVSTPAQTVLYSAVEDVSQPFAGPETPVISEPAPVSRVHLLPPIVIAVWLAGIVVVLLVWTTSWIRVSLIARKTVPLEQGPEVEALRRLESSFGIRTPIRLVLSRNWMEPGIFGIFRPVLIWPEGISQHLDNPHIEAILAHEICHVGRHDNFTALLHMLVEAVFWFHPLVWWMGARLEEERERACDEEVSLLCNQPNVYAESILRVCKFCSESPLACVSGITGADLKKRIVQIMTDHVAHKLDLRRKLLLLTAAAAVIAAPLALGLAHRPLLFAQILHADGPLPSFEVATIRPMQQMRLPPPPGGAAPRVGPNGETIVSQQEIRITNAPKFSDYVDRVTTAKMLIADAYHLPAFSKAQIVGGPDWTEQTMYQFHAKIDDGQYATLQKMSSAQQSEHVRLMEQSLLADRFQLKVHFETREVPVYALEVAKGGPRLTPAKTDSVPAASAAGEPQAPPANMTLTGKGDGFELKARGASPGQLILLLQQQPELGNRLVIDQTGLTGHYDLSLDWTREGSAAADARSDAANSAPSFFTALKEQLGLELVETKGPVEVIVIDHIEKPTVDGAEIPAVAPALVGQANPLDQSLNKAPSSAPQGAGSEEAAALPELRFEAAVIRPSPADANSLAAPQGTAENFSAHMATVESMIGFAYNIPTELGMSNDPAHFYLPHASNLIGGPAWITTDKYDLTAKADPETVQAWSKLPKSDQQEELRRMMRALLEERFHLTMRHETREMPVWKLVVAKGGPKFAESAGTPADVNDNSDPAKPFDKSKPYQQRWNLGPGMLQGRDVSITDFDQMLWTHREIESRKILDQTGLKGKYDLTLKWASVDDPKEPDGPSLFTAIQEQLGLRLESGKAPMDVLVIDHVDRPSPN